MWNWWCIQETTYDRMIFEKVVKLKSQGHLHLDQPCIGGSIWPRSAHNLYLVRCCIRRKIHRKSQTISGHSFILCRIDRSLLHVERIRSSESNRFETCCAHCFRGVLASLNPNHRIEEIIMDSYGREVRIYLNNIKQLASSIASRWTM